MRPETRRWTAISAGGLAVLLGAIDTYVVVTIMTDIMRDVGIPINKIQQVAPIITGYLLGYIAAMPLLGRASDRVGRKLVLQVGLAGFAIGSVVTALAEDLTTLVIGRVILGIAAGALLPVTLALAADLWAARNRAAVLGGIGAAQELGCVLGPLWGIAVVSMLNTWRDVFWINIPLALLAMVMIHFSVPGRDRGAGPRERVDVVGGLLLAIALGLLVIGLYNPEPDGKEVLPSNGLLLVGIALIVTLAFFVWERVSRTKLIEPAGVKFVPFLAALGTSLCAGAALMVTLVNVELFGQGVLGLDQVEAALKLSWFLAALPVGAVLGGVIATRVGDRIVVFVGMLIAAFAYWLVSHWRVDVLSVSHDLGLFELPAFSTDLVIAGFGLGLVIGPLTSAALRVVPSAQHGIASSLVVVARMTGMLIGVAALSAWGLYRFNQILATLPSEGGETLAAKLAAEAARYQLAFSMQYGEMFGVTAIVCVVGAAIGLLIAGKHTHADEGSPGPDLDPRDDAEPATQVLGAARADEAATTRLPAGGGGAHRRRDPR
ncbi:putative triacylglyceride transporter [Mycolicibacterium chitae]|uniref:MFS-type drug efflux transporter P55 n=1 Tax=Mycolicibacterium chitae TaxID=1792 RepID=A0A448I796_MYCCI|nr:MFS transporter [Mycolicibacterium chitae]MCV7107625.1 MFS transporter [Mycolicibacterium chitae]BBZ04729.1 putative triacylglyceride transporter [Mycolicibacterium chitae]VEG48358.1 arabinose efflux permease family protein [Mycolicibacterium chitae]